MLLNDFVNAGVACGVLTEAEFLEHLPAINGSQDPARLAGVLVGAGLLTHYQAQMLLKGAGMGLVLGNYALLDRLGQGGMGDVFRARHRRMDRIVALKTISPHFLRVPDALDRFYREAKAAARLSHPNIVTAHDADEAGGVHFLVMEYVMGSDLDAIVTMHGPLAPDQAMHVVLEAARGLEYAHSKGVVHRDIKPANLMFTLEGTVKILDMGLARIEQAESERFTRTHCGFGSIDYMPPEQADSARLADHRSDIYSLGCTLYKLTTGKVMYENSSVLKTMAGHRDGAIPPLKVAHAHSDRLEALFVRMVAKSPDDRPNSMSEVIAELAPLVGKPDLGPLMIAVRAMHDRPSWLVDPEAKTIRPGEPVTPAPDGSASGPGGETPRNVPPTKRDSNRPKAADPSPSSLAWKTMPSVSGATDEGLLSGSGAPSGGSGSTDSAGPAVPRGATTVTSKEATVPLTIGSAATPWTMPLAQPAAADDTLSAEGLAELSGPAVPIDRAATRAVPKPSPAPRTPRAPPPAGDWLDDVVSASRSAPDLRKKKEGIDPNLLWIGGGVGLGGFVLILVAMIALSGSDDPPETKVAHTTEPVAKKVEPTPVNPVANVPRPSTPVLVAPPANTKPAIEPSTQTPSKPDPEKVDPVRTPEGTPEKTTPEKTTPAKPPPETTPDPPAPDEAIDVLKAVDLKHDAIGKLWTRQSSDGALVARPTVAPGTHTAGQSVMGLQLPVTVTRDYRLKMVVEHLAGYPGPLIVAFPQGTNWRLVVIDDNTPPPDFLPKGPPPPPPPGRPKPPPKGPTGGTASALPPPIREPPDFVIRSGKTELVFRVRNSGQTIELNDEVETAAGPDQPPLREITDLATKKTILVLSLGNYRISSLEYEPNPRD